MRSCTEVGQYTCLELQPPRTLLLLLLRKERQSKRLAVEARRARCLRTRRLPGQRRQQRTSGRIALWKDRRAIEYGQKK